MNYFYATRRDKNGNKLVTSYNKAEQAKKYGGPTASVVKDVFYLDDDGRVTKEETNKILRSKLEAPAVADSEGRFFLASAGKEGSFNPTGMRFPTYGAANNAMKSLVSTYGPMVVVEETDGSERVSDIELTEEPICDESPF